MKTKHILALLIVILIISPVQAQEYNVNRSYTTLKEQWTEVKYSNFIYGNYPEYYPIEISFRSQGKLPRDLREYTNYTGTVFISHFILSCNLSSFDTIDRERDRDELIGEEPLELKFALNVSANVNILSFEIRFQPHNQSLGLSWDTYNFEIEVRKEATPADLGTAVLIFAVPLLFMLMYFLLHKYLNRKFLENIRMHQVPRYAVQYFSLRLWKLITIVTILVGIIIGLVVILL